MSPPPSPSAKTGLGAMKLVGDSFRLVFANAALLFPLALAPTLLIEALMLAVMPAEPPAPEEMFGSGLVFATLAATAAGYLITAVLCLATVDILAGRRRPLGAYFAVATRNILPLIVIGTLVSIAVFIGLIALILPGLYIYAQFFVWIPCIVFEGRGMAAVGRAQSLTVGHRWPIIGGMLVLGLFSAGLFLLSAPLLAAGSEVSGSLITALVAAAVNAVTYAIFAVFTTLVYLRLRGIEDGTGADRLSRGVT